MLKGFSGVLQSYTGCQSFIHGLYRLIQGCAGLCRMYENKGIYVYIHMYLHSFFFMCLCFHMYIYIHSYLGAYRKIRGCRDRPRFMQRRGFPRQESVQ